MMDWKCFFYLNFNDFKITKNKIKLFKEKITANNMVENKGRERERNVNMA